MVDHFALLSNSITKRRPLQSSGNADARAPVPGARASRPLPIAQLKTAPKSSGGPLSCKQSEKGGVSVYGLQRMPVTLYAEQWERLLAFADEIKAFIKDHPALARKRRS